MTRLKWTWINLCARLRESSLFDLIIQSLERRWIDDRFNGVVRPEFVIKANFSAIVSLIACFIFAWTSLAFADAPNQFTYQGRLKVANSPVNGNASIALTFCNAVSGGTCYPAADNTQTVAVSSGLFRAVFNLPTDAGFNLATGPWYLQVYETASGSALSNPLSPRELFTSSPYAMYATSAAYANALSPASGSSIIQVASNLNLANNAGITLSGPSGNITTASSVTASAFFGNGSALSGVSDNARVLKAGDTMTGDLQSGVGANASTYSASGYMTLANLGSAPGASKGRIYFDSTGLGALRISLDGSTFVPLSTGNAGGGISSVASNASQFTGTGVVGTPLTLLSSSVTLQGNAFNGPNQLVQLNNNGGLVLAGSSITLSGTNGYITSVSSINAASFWGDGSHLSGISGSVSGGVPNFISKYTGATTLGTSSIYDSGTGITVAGNSTMTVAGSAFSVGGSTLVVMSGNVGIGTANPAAALSIYSPNSSVAPLNVGLFGDASPRFQLNTGGLLSYGGTASVGSGGLSVVQLGTGSNLVGSGSDLVSINIAGASAPDSNALNIKTSGASKMIVQAAGNVGIGTTSPQTTLDVNGGAQFGSGTAKSTFTAAGGLFIASGSSLTLSGPNGYITSSSSITAASFWGDGSHLGGISGMVSGGSANFVSKYTGSSSLTTSSLYDNGTGVAVTGNSTMTVTGNAFSVGGSTLVVTNGGVGIGTSTLTSALEVASPFNGLPLNAFRVGLIGGSAGNAFVIDNIGRLTYQPANNYSGTPLNFGAGITSINNTDFMVVNPGGTGNIINLQALGASKMVVTTGGNVGIGTNSPAQTLDVNGSAQFGSGASKSTFTAGGNLLISGNVGIGTAGPANTLDVNGGTVFRSSTTWVGLTTMPPISNSSQGGIYFDSSVSSGILRVSENGSAWKPLIAHGQQYFTASGIFGVPSFVSTVFLSMCGGGGAGGGGVAAAAGSGGGAGACVVNFPISVPAGNTVTVTVGTGGNAGNAANCTGNANSGASSTFSSLTLAGGSGGQCGGGVGGNGGPASTTGGFMGQSGGSPSGAIGGNGGPSYFGAPGIGVSGGAGGNGALHSGAGGAGGGGSPASAGGIGADGFVLVSW